MANVRRPFSVVSAVARVTFTEIIRDKVFYNVLLCAFLLFGLGFLVSQLTYLNPTRVVLDFGISAVGISGTLIAIFTGSGLLARELERRTIYLALSHPISRAEFILGKYLGLAQVLILNWILISISFLLILFLQGGWEQGALSSALGWGLFLILFQILFMASAAIFFSTFTTTSLAVIFSLGIYLIGFSVNEMRALGQKIQSPIQAEIVKGISYFLPNLSHFTLGLDVTYGLPIAPHRLLMAVLYGLSLIIFTLTVSGLMIRTREV